MAQGICEKLSVNGKSDKAKDLTEGIHKVNIPRGVGIHPVSLTNNSEMSSLIQKPHSQSDDSDETNKLYTGHHISPWSGPLCSRLDAETFTCILTFLLVQLNIYLGEPQTRLVCAFLGYLAKLCQRIVYLESDECKK